MRRRRRGRWRAARRASRDTRARPRRSAGSGHGGPSLRERAEHGVGEPARAWRARRERVDRLRHRGVARHVVQQLVRAEPERGAHRRVEPVERSLRCSQRPRGRRAGAARARCRTRGRWRTRGRGRAGSSRATSTGGAPARTRRLRCVPARRARAAATMSRAEPDGRAAAAADPVVARHARACLRAALRGARASRRRPRARARP